MSFSLAERSFRITKTHGLPMNSDVLRVGSLDLIAFGIGLVENIVDDNRTIAYAAITIRPLAFYVFDGRLLQDLWAAQYRCLFYATVPLEGSDHDDGPPDMCNSRNRGINRGGYISDRMEIAVILSKARG
jgi:hypothetical protein